MFIVQKNLGKVLCHLTVCILQLTREFEMCCVELIVQVVLKEFLEACCITNETITNENVLGGCMSNIELVQCVYLNSKMMLM